MSGVTITFLVIGGIGIVMLAVSLLAGDLVGADGVDGPLSLPSISGFVGAFGFGGAAAAALTGTGTVATLVGLIVGIAVAIPAAIGTIALSRLAARMRTDATPTRADLVGRLGVVVTSIPADGYGEVRLSLGGQPVKLNARADKPVALGARVFVIEATSDTSVLVEETTGV